MISYRVSVLTEFGPVPSFLIAVGISYISLQLLRRHQKGKLWTRTEFYFNGRRKKISPSTIGFEQNILTVLLWGWFLVSGFAAVMILLIFTYLIFARVFG